MSARSHLLVLIVLAALVVAGVRVALVTSGPASAVPEPGVPTPDRARIAAAARAVRSLGLITVRIETTVTGVSADRSWRGDVNAASSAPCTLYFGVDLAAQAHGALVRLDPLSNELRVRVPEPELLAVEVKAEQERPSVRVSGLRFRDVAGEYHLGLARLALHEQARRLALDEERRLEVRRMSREQIGELVRAIIGDDLRVRVEFAPGELADAHSSSVPAEEAPQR